MSAAGLKPTILRLEGNALAPAAMMTSSTMSNAFTLLTQNSKQQEQSNQQASTEATKIAKIHAKANYRPQNQCSKFNPDDIKNKINELSVYANWRSEFIEVHNTMVTLGYTPVEMYNVLRSLLGGKAKQMIMVKEPNADTYQKSIDLLNDAFYSKALHVRDIVHRLKMLPVMDHSSASKNQLWKTEAFNLMIQLSEMTQDSQDELKFLLFSEILLPKLNSEANKLWEKKITDENNISDQAHLGHTLGMDDLKKVIAKSTQILQQRELNKFYNGKKYLLIQTLEKKMMIRRNQRKSLKKKIICHIPQL